MNRISVAMSFLMGLAFTLTEPGTCHAALPRPNVVLIVVDELGYQFVGANGGLTCRGVPISTPNIDALAKTGVRWTHAHARAMCGPTRQTLMTGKHGFRYNTPPLEMPFIPGLMKNAGYATGHVGKWMMGTFYNPRLKGYNEAAVYCGNYQFYDPRVMTFNAPNYLSEFNQPADIHSIKGGDMHCPTVDNVFKEKHATVLKGQFGPDVMNRYACEFIDRHKDHPFFLYYATKLAHIQHPKIPDFGGEPSYANSVNYVDVLVGRVVKALETACVRDNTLILLIGDNGHNDSPADQPSIAKGQPYLPGKKGGLYECATRVPFIASWPAGGASGVVRDEVMCVTDLLPTCVAAAQGQLPEGDTFDGVSLLPQIQGEPIQRRDWVYIHNGSHPTITNSELKKHYETIPKTSRRYVVGTQYKLMWDGRFYDLKADIEETTNIPLGTGSMEAEAARRKFQGVLNYYGERMGADHADPTLVPKANVPASISMSTQPSEAPTGKMKKLADGFRFTEGPAWDGKDSLYFSDMPNNALHRWTEADGTTLIRKGERNSNGIVVDRDGGLIFCEGGRRIVRRTSDGKETTLADQCAGKPIGMPNDLWLAPDGGIYFTIPRIKPSDADRYPKGAVNGTVCYITPDRKSVVDVGLGLKSANGIVGRADGKFLYVADPRSQKCFRYTIQADGQLTNQQVAADRFSDGLTLDEHGQLYTTSNEGIRVFSTKGQEIALIAVPETPANMTFGGRDGKTLFITARTSVYAVDMNVRGDFAEPVPKKPNP